MHASQRATVVGITNVMQSQPAQSSRGYGYSGHETDWYRKQESPVVIDSLKQVLRNLPHDFVRCGRSALEQRRSARVQM